jgi:hypothetical protein
MDSYWGAYLTGKLPQPADAPNLPSTVSSVDDVLRSIAAARAASGFAPGFPASQCGLPVTGSCVDGKRDLDAACSQMASEIGYSVLVDPSDDPGLSKRFRRS